MSLKERETSKLVLSGLSVIDWPRLYFQTRAEVAQFLRVNEFDLNQSKDRERLRAVHGEAVSYLRGQLQYRLPPSVLNPSDPGDLFLAASASPEDPVQPHACSLLKAMSIVNHVDGRELLYNAPISQRQLYAVVEDKVERELSTLVREGQLVRYEGGRKAKESLVTKLLCKRETIAAQIYDRVRYRMVTRTKDDLLALMLRLFQDLLPINYLIPGASVNQLIDRSYFLSWKERLSVFGAGAASGLANNLSRLLPFPGSEQEYSGGTYHVVKFVVDIPVRLDRFLSATASSVYTETLGSIVYVLVEFQMVDERTELNNQQGDNDHDEYKKRQKMGIVGRLLGG